ncbi:hypothetical protein P152DRAFT_474692 [Eremomyces bilateralis CBS 781.70]|uniref:S-adenosyl-L-methionine-dependent methyltransferase n=1 Tax=Eremomyces bilateralis CBS 781.70 TaxID=1392243 RepID=A0A6G1G0F8_9PEZI|nr:uncharacterized protein P152DRAFT_474692 [Eremomyces bilateralis CBS 781.70]KAF1811534.1 hypothetical protein P152DRAFT_474692 [Eremomyces bilateralis CBS 781.70]
MGGTTLQSYNSFDTSTEADLIGYTEHDGPCGLVFLETGYPFPTNLSSRRLDTLRHRILQSYMRFLAGPYPNSGGLRVIDMEAGPEANWATDFAIANPNSTVEAIDIVPIVNDKLPTNLEFRLDDAEVELVKHYDVIHLRNFYPKCWRAAL